MDTTIAVVLAFEAPSILRLFLHVWTRVCGVESAQGLGTVFCFWRPISWPQFRNPDSVSVDLSKPLETGFPRIPKILTCSDFFGDTGLAEFLELPSVHSKSGDAESSDHAGPEVGVPDGAEKLRGLADELKAGIASLGYLEKNLARRVKENLANWTGGSVKPHLPTEKGVAYVAAYLWRCLRAPKFAEKRKVFIDKARRYIPELQQEWDSILLRSRLKEFVRNCRLEILRSQHLADSDSEQLEEPNWTDEPSDPIERAVIISVDRFLLEAGFRVTNGTCSLDEHRPAVSLRPLYAYIQRLQKSATIPSYFPGIPYIKLDALYVELCAAEDQRGLMINPSDSWEEADAVPKDHLGVWREAVSTKRVPIPTLLSGTELLPAVVLGDPGSGKSTLTLHLLHELGRAFVNPRHALRLNAIPFRIALGKFAKTSSGDGYSILRHIARQELGVPDSLIDDWVTFLSHLFTDTKPLKLLLLLDAVDEVPQNLEKHGLFRRRIDEVSSIARIIFTSRRAGFQPLVQSFKAFELIELSELSIHGLIRNCFTVVWGKPLAFIQSFTSWIFSDARRQEMARNPCLLSLLCYLNHDQSEGHFLQANCRTRLYELATEKLVAAFEGNLPLERGRLQAVLAGLALQRYRAEGDRRTPLSLFSASHARDFVEKWQDDSGKLPAESDAVLDAWRKLRLVFQWDLGNWHTFLHLTFQEYFAAKALARLPAEDVARIAERHRFDPHWREVWRFYAGHCRTAGSEGLVRFRRLVQLILEDRDLFGEVDFIAAPLCAEAGISDTTRILGFDLKLRLYETVLARFQESMAVVATRPKNLDWANFLEMQEARLTRDVPLIGRIRVMVELDPGYFLDVAQSSIARALAARDSSSRQSAEFVNLRAEGLMGVIVLGNIYHPRAFELQRHLIAAEASDSELTVESLPVGPLLPNGRNEQLCEAIAKSLPEASSWLAKARLVRYLANTRSPDAAAVLLAAARNASASKPQKEALAFRGRCLGALCDLQDPAAVELARDLARHPRFRSDYLSQACSSLPQVRLPAVAALLEEWLEHGIVPTEDIAFEHLLTELRQWPERAVPPMIEALVAGETTPLPLRAKAWELLLIRTGLQGVKRFRERIRKDLDAGRLGEFAWRELASLAEVAARNRLPVEIELTELARRVPKRFALERQRIWGALFDWHAANARIPSSHRWLLNEGVPQLEAELRECSQADTDVPWVWLEVFGECPEPILSRLAETIIRLRDVLEPGVLAELMHNFSRHPKLLPADLIANAKDSEDSDLRTVGLELMLECDPGSLVASRESEPAIDKLLRETATNCGILFFNDRLYSPETASFVPYRGCNPK